MRFAHCLYFRTDCKFVYLKNKKIDFQFVYFFWWMHKTFFVFYRYVGCLLPFYFSISLKIKTKLYFKYIYICFEFQVYNIEVGCITTMPRHNRNRRHKGYKTNPISINVTTVECLQGWRSAVSRTTTATAVASLVYVCVRVYTLLFDL